jgi:hypothetical protein
MKRADVEIKEVERYEDGMVCPYYFIKTVKGYENLTEEEKQRIVKEIPYFHESDLCFVDTHHNAQVE